jgi:hypothetical protein
MTTTPEEVIERLAEQIGEPSGYYSAEGMLRYLFDCLQPGDIIIGRDCQKFTVIPTPATPAMCQAFHDTIVEVACPGAEIDAPQAAILAGSKKQIEALVERVRPAATSLRMPANG